MNHDVRAVRSALLIALVTAPSLAGCGREAAAARIAVAPLADRTVVRNTLAPSPVELAVEIDGGREGTFSLTLEADDATVVAPRAYSCAHNPCHVAFTPSPEANAAVRVTVGVAAGGATGATSFGLRLVPRLVRDRTDAVPAPADSLRDVIARANPGDVVGFDVGGAFEGSRTIELTSQLTIGKDVTIEGPGAAALVLAPRGAHRLIALVESSNLDLRGVTLRDGDAGNGVGGAIAVGAGGHLHLAGCEVRSSHAAEGGAIAASQGDLTIDGCTFVGNAAARGGAVAVHGGALEVRASTFGGKSTADPNTAAAYGGAIYAEDAHVGLTATTFLANRADGTTSMAVDGGGAVAAVGAASGLSVDGGLFERNTSGNYGGAVLLVGGPGSLADVDFVANEARQGGAMYVSSSHPLTLQGSVFDANVAAGTAGVEATAKRFELSDDAFHDHRGGGVLTLTAGGGETSVAHDLTIADSALSGSALTVRAGRVTFDDLTVVRTRSTGAGAALRVGGGASVVARRAILTDNSVAGSGDDAAGGAVLVTGSLVLDGGELRRNRARLGGAVAVRAKDSTLAAHGPLIEDNQADSGGALYLGPGTEALLDDDARFYGNRAADSGGALYLAAGAALAMTGGEIARGSAGVWGGAIYTAGSLDLGAVSVSHNTSEDGGGLYVVQAAADTVANVELAGTGLVANEASVFGGGIFAASGRVSADRETQIVGNRAFDGGGLYATSADVSDVDANFALNEPNDVAP